MRQLAITIKAPARARKVLVELDANQFETLASVLGFFSTDFLASVNRAEKDLVAGQTREISSLKELRNKFD
ncbi:hypothetical protein HY968_00840 [Candidatus Kaiserbacteria bacterium]|nr:hypothetical protein [Candidatus Kaiserbacteria bacterium]